ncbi:MAG TPA: FliH/SctL family protein [Anaeromyxobacter sp.]|nr:FliH/SctL family protein [Anaeromyxobacter sp.]
MNRNARQPGFLSSLEVAGASCARPAAFASPSARDAQPRPALGPRAPAPPPGPTPEQLAALRAEAMLKVAGAVEALRREASRLAEAASADALELGFLVARRILEAELKTSPDALAALVRATLGRAGDARKVTVRLHPQDAEALAPALSTDGLGVVAAVVEVVPEPSLSPGDCVVDTDYGKLDGRLQTRLDELWRAAVAEEGAP